MKDLNSYINESIFDEEDQLDELDCFGVDLQTLFSAKSEEEFNELYELLKKRVEKEGKLVKLKHDYLLPHEPRKTYIIFRSNTEKTMGFPNRVIYGTAGTSYRMAWNKHYVSNLQWSGGMRTAVANIQDDNGKKVYYLPDSLKKGYNKVIKIMK